MRGAIAPNHAFFDPLLVPLYWSFLCALFVNAVYPSVLLRSANFHTQREAVAACDATLDIIYFFTFFLSCFGTLALNTLLPFTPYDYVATLYPLLHVYGVARSLETIAKRRTHVQPVYAQSEQHVTATAAATQLPRSAAVAFSAFALCVIGVVLMITASDCVYPFERQSWPCRPCECEGGTLTRCPIAVDLGVTLIGLREQGITALAPRALAGALKYVSLAHNHIDVVSASAFDDARGLVALDLSDNNISVVEGTFPRSLQSLALHGNRIHVMQPGFVAEGLHILFIDENRMREIETGSFDGFPRLEYVWMGGNEVNCSTTRDALPIGARCIEARCAAISGLFTIGNGICNAEHDPKCMTEECAWDGGDCSWWHGA